MRFTDIAIIGGGLAGSLAAVMLGRAGIRAILIDPHERYPLDFRVEKSVTNASLSVLPRPGLQMRSCDQLVNAALLAHLSEITEKVICEEVHRETGEAGEIDDPTRNVG